MLTLFIKKGGVHGLGIDHLGAPTPILINRGVFIRVHGENGRGALALRAAAGGGSGLGALLRPGSRRVTL